MNIPFIIRRICSLILIGIGYYLFWPKLILEWDKKGLGVINNWLSMGLFLFFVLMSFLFIVRLVKLLLDGYMFNEENGSLRKMLLFLLPIQDRKTLLRYAGAALIFTPPAIELAEYIFSDRFHFHPAALVVGCLISYCAYWFDKRKKRKTVV